MKEIRTLDHQRVIREMAGLLSTMEFKPSAAHPQDCIPMAERLFDYLAVGELYGALSAAVIHEELHMPECRQTGVEHCWLDWARRVLSETPMNSGPREGRDG